jgi:hypothetical protein
MSTSIPSHSIESRLANLERQLVLWRRLAIGALGMILLTGGLAFRRAAPGPLEGTSLTLLGARGSAVVLSLRPSGELEARFRQGAENASLEHVSSSLVLVGPHGREVVRIGHPTARQLAP